MAALGLADRRLVMGKNLQRRHLFGKKTSYIASWIFQTVGKSGRGSVVLLHNVFGSFGYRRQRPMFKKRY